MNIRLLRIFQEVCQTENITRASETLHMTQPAVSQAIRDLEKETGLVLFERLGRRILVSEMGRTYLGKVKPLLELCDALEASTQQILDTTPMRVGCCLTIAQSWLPDMMARFRQQCKTPVHVTAAGAHQILALLRDNQIDFALYEGVSPAAPFTSHVFSTYQLVPVCASAHPFSGKMVSLKDFLGEPLLLREPGSAIRDVLDSFLRLKGLTAQPVVTSTNSQALLHLFEKNIGVGILADKILPSSLGATGLATFSVEGMQLQNDNRIIYHQDKVISDSMQAFFQIAESVAAS